MKLRAYLDQKRLKLREFAAMTGLTASTISRLAAGKQAPSLDVAERIHRATNGRVKPEDFYRENGQ